MFDVEKPIVFIYEEILSCTDGFSESNLVGHGTYGSVYYGLLREQEVAVKKMTATKTKEFIAEMKVLCKVHHTNLVKQFIFSLFISSSKVKSQNHFLTLLSVCGFVVVKVELIGYAASDDELFLVYEYAQKGSLGSHLHDPQNKGNFVNTKLLIFLKK